jgi:hypothetical protein
VSEPWWRTLLREQQGSGFSDLTGAEASLVLPVSDRLLTSLVAARLPPTVPVSALQLTAEPGERFAVRLKLTAPAFLPAFTLRFVIVEQPELPGSPVVTCALLGGNVATFMGPVLRLFATLPPGIQVDRDRIRVNLAELAQRYGFIDAFRVLTEVRLTTAAGRFIVAARASLPQRPSP